MSGEPTSLMAADSDAAETRVIAGARVDCGPSGAAGMVEAKASGGALEAAKWLFSFPVMLGTLLVGWAFSVLRTFYVDPDVWWHIKVGQDILRTHHWPTTDSYSFTAMGTPWIAYEWLGDVALGTLARGGGLLALFGFQMTMAVLVILGLFYLATLRSDNSKAGFVAAGLMSTLALISMTLRPQMIGYLFLIVLLIVLEYFRKGVSWPIWWLPLLFLVWVNVHGSFVVGLGVLCIYLCGGLKGIKLGSMEAVAWGAKQILQLEWAILLCVAVLPITPYGTKLAAYPLDMMFRQPLNTANIVEWQPMAWDTVGGKLFLVVVLLLLLLQFLFRYTLRAEDVLLAFIGAAAACLHFRMLLLFVPFTAPLLASMIARWIDPYKSEKDQYLLNALIMAGVLAVIAYYWPSRAFLEKQVSARFPVAAVKYLDTHLVSGPMLNSYGFGGFLIGTGRKVFIDGRGDLFERSNVLGDMITIAQVKPGAMRLLDRYGIASCLLDRGEPLTELLGASPGWKRVYQDETATIFVKQNAKNGESK